MTQSNDFLYGLCGGFIGTIISHPFDTIKTRIQSNKAPNIMSALMMKKLYSGLTPPLLGIMLEKSIVFGFYNKAKEQGLNNFWSGIIGGFMCTLIVTPVDRLKIYFQNNSTYTLKENLKTKQFIFGYGYLLQNTINKNIFNIKELYRGFIPTICRETPGFGIYFTTYNYLTTNYNNTNTSYKTFIFGALSGLAAWTFIYPSDLVKTKIQSSTEKISLQKIIKIIFSENNSKNNIFGLKNFYKGFNLAIMRALPLHGGVFLGYEMSKKYLEN
jgi:hypothetical protein